MPRSLFRSRILHFLADPSVSESAWEFFEDGLLVVEDGYVQQVGEYDQLQSIVTSDDVIEHFPEHLIIPGFVDTHVHYPQTEMIAAYGEQLLSWLNNYTFPVEQKFSDSGHSERIANFFLSELLRNGTTTALVFCTVHPASVDAFFRAAQQRNLRMIAGKVLMDRNAPPGLCDCVQQSYDESTTLIGRWHKTDRLSYAVTPRFAATSSREQLDIAGSLLREHSDVYMHTHIAENRDEVAWVKTLFPDSAGYLDVYDRSGLLNRRSVLAHGIHLSDQEWSRLGESGSSIAHCPTSNLFLGSGLFNLQKARSCGVSVGLGTDVGAGTSFSLLRTLDEAYKVQQLQGVRLDPFSALYLATLGGAKALDLDDQIGNFLPGKEADFSVLDLQATPLMAMRTGYCQSLEELLFVINTLGDDRAVARTYIMGECGYQRGAAE